MSESLATVSEIQNELASDYYLTNFRLLIDFVYEHYSFLLNGEEQAFYQRFYQLPNAAQQLLIRFLSRKGELFRLDKLNYPEIESIHDAVEALRESCFIESFDISESSDWLKLFNKKELLTAFQQDEWKGLSRKALDEAILNHIATHPVPSELQTIPMVRVPQQLFDNYRLLFFGNCRQDLTEFVLQDLGLVTYENYVIAKQHLPIQSRAQMQALKRCHELSEVLHDTKAWSLETVNQLLEAIPEKIPNAALLNRRADRLRLSLARHLERFGEFECAIEHYRCVDELPSNERMIRSLEKLQNDQEAWENIQQLKQSTRSQQEKQFIQVFEPKLAKKLDREFTQSKNYVPKEHPVELPATEPSVELDVANYLNGYDAQVFWVENHWFNALFALTYWQAIFADVAGAFYNPFQTAPLDIYSKRFVERRQDIIDDIHGRTVESNGLKALIKQNAKEKWGIACRFVYWPSLTTEHLDLLLERMPEEHLRKIVRHILDDRKENRAGMPDLIQFPSSGGYELVEVKGPGDRLQNNQKAWMQFYHERDIPHRVIRVLR